MATTPEPEPRDVTITPGSGLAFAGGVAPIIQIGPAFTMRATMRPGWEADRDAILTRVEQARTLCTSAADLLDAVVRTPARPGDNSGALREAAIEAVSGIVATAGATLGSLRDELTADQPNATTVGAAGHTLTLLGWAWMEFAGGMLHAAGEDAYHYLRDHHAELFHQLEGLMGHVFHLAPAVHTLLV